MKNPIISESNFIIRHQIQRLSHGDTVWRDYAAPDSLSEAIAITQELRKGAIANCDLTKHRLVIYTGVVTDV